jgi:glucan phosphoethanolaminetransferase (alkaline phosphatase superfamily)
MLCCAAQAGVESVFFLRTTIIGKEKNIIKGIHSTIDNLSHCCQVAHTTVKLIGAKLLACVSVCCLFLLCLVVCVFLAKRKSLVLFFGFLVLVFSFCVVCLFVCLFLFARRKRITVRKWNRLRCFTKESAPHSHIGTPIQQLVFSSNLQRRQRESEQEKQRETLLLAARSMPACLRTAVLQRCEHFAFVQLLISAL